MDIRRIAEAIKEGRVWVTDHADEEAQADSLKLDEIYCSAIHGQVIEDYPDDKPYPSCLVFGLTPGGDPVHSVWACNEKTRWAVLITVYRPDPDRWTEWRERKEPDETV